MNIQREHLISFGKMNKYYILPFITPVVSMIRNSLIFIIKDKNASLELDLLFLILSSFEYFASGLILYLFSHYTREKKKKMIYINSVNDESSLNAKISGISISVSEQNAGQNYKLKLFLLLTVMAISPILNFPFGFFTNDPDILETRYYCFLFITGLSRCLLGIKIYRHQLFSIIISSIGFIIFGVLFFKDNKFEPLDNLRYLISCGVYSLYLVLLKYLTKKYYFFSPGKIFMSIGVIMLVLVLIGAMIFSLIDKKDLSFFKLSFDLNIGLLEIIFLVIIFFLHIIYNILTFSVIFYFNPNHFIITDIFKPFLFWTFRIIYKSITEENYSYALQVIGYVIQFIAALIYNEIIILNFWKLNVDTVKGLHGRLIYETNNLKAWEDEKKEGIRDTLIEMEGGYKVNIEKTRTTKSIGLLNPRASV